MFLQGAPLDFDWYKTHEFWDKAELLPDGQCWLWQQSTASHGYGQTWDGVTVRLAHRVAWALWHQQQIPEGMTIDHMCHVKRCVNPDHLRLLTNAENARDGMARKTHCPSGHPYEGDNLYIQPSNGSRRCRTCASSRRMAA